MSGFKSYRQRHHTAVVNEPIPKTDGGVLHLLRASCSCGWRSKLKATMEHAHGSATEHEESKRNGVAS